MPRDTSALLARAVRLHRDGKLEKAVVCYEQALALSPNIPEVLSNLAIALKALGKSDAAIARLEQALALRPNTPEILANLGILLREPFQEIVRRVSEGLVDAGFDDLRPAHTAVFQHIDADGFLYVQPIGGWDMQILLGQHLTVWASTGPIPAVIARRAPHLMSPDERNKVPQFADVWVDIGAKDKKDAESLVTPGDPVTVALGYRPMRNGLAASRVNWRIVAWATFELRFAPFVAPRRGTAAQSSSVEA